MGILPTRPEGKTSTYHECKYLHVLSFVYFPHPPPSNIVEIMLSTSKVGGVVPIQQQIQKRKPVRIS
jgi:hypothetical protein